jgi:hypothetical protein
MAKLTLTDAVTGFLQPSVTNANNSAIEAAIENTISRDGTSPNQMNANLDMNSYEVINLKAPSGPNSAARLLDVTNQSIIVGITLPSQTGQNGKALTTDGAALQFTAFPTELPSQATNANKQLQTDGSVATWQPLIPTQATNAGKVLQTDGTSTSWQVAVPSQTGNSGKFLTTNGSVASWGALTAGAKVVAYNNVGISVSDLTTMQDVPQLQVTLPQPGTYKVDAKLWFYANTTSTAGIALALYNATGHPVPINTFAFNTVHTGWVNSGPYAGLALSNADGQAGTTVPTIAAAPTKNVIEISGTVTYAGAGAQIMYFCVRPNATGFGSISILGTGSYVSYELLV